MVAIDISGHKFGKLTAIEVVDTGKKRLWKCRCDCGGEVTAPTFQLRGGHITKCKNPWHTVNRVKLEKVGDLTILDIKQDTKNRRPMYLCGCKCGNKKWISGKNLSRRVSKNCGCKIDYSNLGKPKGVAGFNKILSSYKGNAKSRGLYFNLTKEEFKKLTQSDCYYCGDSPSKVSKSTKGDFIYNGVDRKDSSKGYTIDNCVPCCSTCNYMKNNIHHNTFITIITKIYNNINQ